MVKSIVKRNEAGKRGRELQDWSGWELKIEKLGKVSLRKWHLDNDHGGDKGMSGLGFLEKSELGRGNSKSKVSEARAC